MKRINHKVIIMILASLIIMPCWSKTIETNNEPIRIESDNVTFLQESVEIIYQGNVVVHSGQKTLKADTVTVQRNKQQKIQSIIAVGQPALFTTPMEKSAHLLNAQAKNIDYNPNKSLIVLSGQAKLKLGSDTFEGPILKYLLDEQKIEAVTKNNQRPKMIIVPAKGAL